MIGFQKTEFIFKKVLLLGKCCQGALPLQSHIFIFLKEVNCWSKFYYLLRNCNITSFSTQQTPWSDNKHQYQGKSLNSKSMWLMKVQIIFSNKVFYFTNVICHKFQLQIIENKCVYITLSSWWKSNSILHKHFSPFLIYLGPFFFFFCFPF